VRGVHVPRSKTLHVHKKTIIIVVLHFVHAVVVAKP